MFLLHSRLAGFRRKVERAEGIVREWIGAVENPYIAFSGGKDSTCVLHLVRAAKPKTSAVYLDADCAFPEAIALLDATPDLIRFPCLEPFLQTLKRYSLHDDALERETQRTTVSGVIPRLLKEYGFDACAYGLRSEESSKRRMHFAEHRYIFRSKGYGILTCQPIADWTYRDVWAYIFSQGLPYCKTYDRMWWMPQRQQRISYWAGESERRNGRYAWLKRNYPDLYYKLAKEIPSVTCYV